MNNEHKFAHRYTAFKTTNMLDQDLKIIRKINNILFKYEKSEKISYIYETINIFKGLRNYYDIVNGLDQILFYIEPQYTAVVEYIIRNIDDVNLDTVRENYIVPSK